MLNVLYVSVFLVVWQKFLQCSGLDGKEFVCNAWKLSKRCCSHHRSLLHFLSLFNWSIEGSWEAELDVELHALGLPLHALHPQVVHQDHRLHRLLCCLKLNHPTSSPGARQLWREDENYADDISLSDYDDDVERISWLDLLPSLFKSNHLTLEGQAASWSTNRSAI